MRNTIKIAAFALMGMGVVFEANAQEAEPYPRPITTNDPTVNAMIGDWSRYDEACRGTLPEDGAEGFCGAREYIGWSLNQSGVCLAQDDEDNLFWEACNAESVLFDDPLAKGDDEVSN